MRQAGKKMDGTCFNSFLICLVISFVSKLQATITCPSGCTCRTDSVKCEKSELMKTVPENLPDNETLTSLSITYTSITHIKVSDFNNYKHVQRLDLSHNAIEDVARFTFTDMAALQSLVLRNNFLRELVGWEFLGLQKLKVLDLSWNSLVELPSRCFSMMNNVEHIDLSENAIELIHEDVFVGLDKLKVLNMTGNSLIIVSKADFGRLGSLERLVLNNNAIQMIENESFSSMKRMKYLSLSGNKELTFFQREVIVSNTGSPNLETLILNGTGLTKVPGRVLKSLRQLQHIDLSHTNITVIRNTSFSRLNNLTSLALNFMPVLSTIEQNAFRRLNSLVTLSITDSRQLRKLPDGAFKSLRNLRMLYLRNNGLQSISEGLANWGGVDVIDLRGNPLRCDCAASWLLTLLHQRQHTSRTSSFVGDTHTPVHVAVSFDGDNQCNDTCTYTTDGHQSNTNRNKTVLFARQIVCESPSRLNGTRLDSLMVRDFGCHLPRGQNVHTRDRLTVGLATTAVACAFLLAVAVFIKYRRRILSRCRDQYRYKAHRDFTEMRQSSLIDCVEL